uniref:Uncharacterized protein n=1 Tax=Schistosoma mansoni TaxID=6183 RepID=A0A5K4F8U8_SCHMA
MAKSDLILTPYQVFILPCIILIFWSLFLIVFKSDGSGTWRRDIDWFILTQGKQIQRIWFVFNETEEVCSCVTGFEKCNIREIIAANYSPIIHNEEKKNISNREKDYLCTCPTYFNHGVITYCTKSNYEKDSLQYEDDFMDLFVKKHNKDDCQHYGGYSSLEYRNPEKEITQCSIWETLS